MRKHLLLALLLACTFPAFAQYEYLAVTGAIAGIKALKAQPQKAEEYVNQVNYQGRTIPQKRSPLYKVPGKARTQIAAVEQLLTSRYAALQADATSPVLTPEREAEIGTALDQLQAVRPQWSTMAYSDELHFYRQEDARRQAAHAQMAQQQAAQRQARERARRDSVERLTR